MTLLTTSRLRLEPFAEGHLAGLNRMNADPEVMRYLSDGRPETIDETAAMITAAGGTATALRVDHTNEVEVKALFRRILRAHKRIDIVVDSVAGEDPMMGVYGFLWQADMKNAEAIFRQGLISRIITAKHAALAMRPARRGLIVEVTENDMLGGGGNPMAQAVKMGQKLLPLLWAAELASSVDAHPAGAVDVAPPIDLAQNKPGQRARQLRAAQRVRR